MAVGTIYVDTGGATTNSGTSDTNSAIVSGSAATAVTTTITLDAGTVLTGVAVDGSQAIYLGQATNSNQKIFWITASSGSGGATPTVTVSVAPSGITSSTWAIGGRLVYTSANIEAALRAGDTVQFNNTPASKAAVFFTARVSGDKTTGKISLIGKTGVRPVLATTGNNIVLSMNDQANYYVSNLELQIAGTQSAVQSCLNSTFNNVKISGGTSGSGIVPDGFGTVVTNCDISVGGDGINGANLPVLCIGNYIHGCGGSAIVHTGTNYSFHIINNLIVGNTGRGILFSGAIVDQAYPQIIINNTIAGNTLAGIEVTDPDTTLFLQNNIITNSNSAALVTWISGNASFTSYHSNNLFYSSSSGALNGITANSTELTSDPLYTNSAGGDYTLTSSSPAKGTGFPGQILNVTGLGYNSMGAFQPQASASGRMIGS